jgi:hypothetical protein
MIQMLACNLAVLAIAMLYYAWRDSYSTQASPRQRINERVAYMLWVAAQRTA